MDPFNKGELTESITISNPNITGSLFSKGILKLSNLALVLVFELTLFILSITIKNSLLLSYH
jgi:hypothetical protein